LNLGVGTLKSGSATFPMPGIDPVMLDDSGKGVADNTKGFLAIKKPWPGLMLGLNNDPERYKSVYFSKCGVYNNGNYAIRDSEEYYWLLGISDEVMKVSGHIIGTIEVEDALIIYPRLVEAAVFLKPYSVKGESIIAFVYIQ
jgi:acetyl-CoA synthetase